MTMRMRASMLVGFLSALTAGGTVHGDISGFNSLNGWTYNQGDSGTPPVIVNDNLIHFTTGPDNARSLWYNTPQDISSFQATFTYRAGSISASSLRQGVTFAIHNSPTGLGALGPAGPGLGYAGVAPSLAVTIENDTGPGLTYSGVYMNGILGGGSMPITPVSAFTFEDIDVTITYSGSILSVTMAQGANVFGRQDFLVGSLSSLLGSSTAYVGFTGGTFNTLGFGGGSNQFLGDFQFTAVPAPSSLALLSVLGITAKRRRRM